MSTPVGESVVGWNCIISMSFSGTPTRSAIAIEAAVQEVPGDDALAAVVVDDEAPAEELLVDLDVALHELLIEHLDEDVARDVGRVRRAGRAGGAEGPLRDPAVLGAREDGAPVLE